MKSNKSNQEQDDLFLQLNKTYFDNIQSQYKKLFNITNFCVKNRWGSYDFTLCRMAFLQESQYNEHEKHEVHTLNLEKCAISNNEKKIFKTNVNNENFYELINNYEMFQPVVFLSLAEHNSNALPWRESNSKIIYIETNGEELINYNMLEENLIKFKNSIIKIGSFS